MKKLMNELPLRTKKINFKKMILKGLFGVITGMTFGFIIGGIIINVFKLQDSTFWIAFFITWILTIFLFGLWGAKSKTKEEERIELQKSLISNDGLTRNEKTIAWIFSICNPIITGAVMYYLWRKQYPNKAKKANHISMLVFLVEIIFIIIHLIIK